MNLRVLALPLLLVATLASARDQTIPTPAKAEQNLKAAKREMSSAFAAFARTVPAGNQAALKADQDAWEQRVKAGCAPESDGLANSGAAAAVEYAIETQCTADATLDRARMVRDAAAP